jgi:hydrogenase maturation protease
MSPPRILVAGIGNVFLGDDGFGVAVAQHLARHGLPKHVRLMDAGIRGIDLTYALMDGYDAAILVDTTARGGSPGTLYVLEPEPGDASAQEPPSLIDAHGMDPARVLAFVRASGASLRCLRVIGCEPASFGTPDEPQLKLSAAVRNAVPAAAELVVELIAQLGQLEHARPAGTAVGTTPSASEACDA